MFVQTISQYRRDQWSELELALVNVRTCVSSTKAQMYANEILRYFVLRCVVNIGDSVIWITIMPDLIWRCNEHAWNEDNRANWVTGMLYPVYETHGSYVNYIQMTYCSWSECTKFIDYTSWRMEQNTPMSHCRHATIVYEDHIY